MDYKRKSRQYAPYGLGEGERRKTQTFKQKSFHVYLTSNAEIEGVTDNSLTKFTNILAKPIQFKNRKQWRIGLKSIHMSNNITSKYDTDFIQVQCDQISEDHNSNRILSIHSKPPTEMYLNNHEFTPRNIEWFTPESDYIDRFSFTLLDNHFEQIRLAPAHPTVILLCISKMFKDEEEQFTVRVFSRPTDVFPENKPHHFQANLSKSHEQFFQSPYEVAVNSISYTPNFTQSYYHTPPEIKITHWTQDLPQEVIIEFDPKKQYSCNDDLICYLNDIFQGYYSAEGKERGFPLIKVEEDQVTGGSAFAANYMAEQTSLTIEFPYNLAVQLGFFGSVSQGEMKGTIQILPPPVVTHSQQSMNVEALKPRSLMIYTNFTEPVLVGSGMSSIIKIFPISEGMIRSATHLTQESQSLEFFKIEQSSLHDLEFKLYQINGDRIHFQNPHDEVVLSLIFRKKRNVLIVE